MTEDLTLDDDNEKKEPETMRCKLNKIYSNYYD